MPNTFVCKRLKSRIFLQIERVRMKKIITLSAIFALSLSAISFSNPAEAKRGFSISPVRSTPVRKPATQKTQQQKTAQQQKDADFNNTPPKQAMPNNAAAAQPQGNRLANFATGAMAGYLLSDMLSPNEAQAQQTQAAQTGEPLQQLTKQVQQTPAQPQIPVFKAIDPQNDPFLIERTQGYLRYCLNGVQYLISTANTQLPPTLMVDRSNAPAQCVIVQ